jgi:hypothetical protein
MPKRAVKSLLWWLPAIILAAFAGIMPDTFLDSPHTTIPHEGAFLVRLYVITAAFAYIVGMAVIRGAMSLGKW